MIMAALWCGLLNAQTQQQVDVCESKGSPPLDAIVGGCTALIQSGTYAGRDLSTVFIIRATAHQRKGDLDRAIQDYDQAARLEPNFAAAVYGRGVAKEQTGDKTGAEADIAAARTIDPVIGK